MYFADIIRYIVVNIHPTNEELKGDKTKRWEIINHLLVSTTDVFAFSFAGKYKNTLQKSLLLTLII